MRRVFGRERAVVFRRGLVALPTLEVWDHVAVIVVVIVSARELLFMPAVFAFERCGEVAAVLAEYRFDFHGFGWIKLVVENSHSFRFPFPFPHPKGCVENGNAWNSTWKDRGNYSSFY